MLEKIVSIGSTSVSDSRSTAYRTSRGVPARLRILTMDWTPLASSNARKAFDESTRMHRSVSRTIDVSGGGVVLGIPWVGAVESEDGEEDGELT